MKILAQTFSRLYGKSPVYRQEFHAKLHGAIHANHETNKYGNGIGIGSHANRKVSVS